jgi:hypothetical protein
MSSRSRIAVVCALCVIATAVGSTAEASSTQWRGWASNSRYAKAKVTNDFTVLWLTVGWVARCRRPGYVFTSRTLFRVVRNGAKRQHPRSSDPSSVQRDLRARGGYVLRLKNGARAVIRIRFSALLSHDALNDHGDSVNGRLRGRITVRRRGRTLDSCSIRRSRFQIYREGL